MARKSADRHGKDALERTPLGRLHPLYADFLSVRIRQRDKNRLAWQRAEVARVGVRVVCDALHEYLLPGTIQRAVGEQVDMLVLRILVVWPAGAVVAERKHLAAILDDAYMTHEDAVLAFLHIRRETSICIGRIPFSELAEPSASVGIAPELDLCALDRLARLRAIDCSLELAVARLEDEGERRHRDILREERQLVRAELVVRRGVEHVVAGLDVGRRRKDEILLAVRRLEGERLLPLLCRLALDVFELQRVGSVVAASRSADRAVVDQVVERDGHEPKVDFREIARRHLDLRPGRAPVALRLEGELWLFDLGNQVGAPPAADRPRPFRGVCGGKFVRGDAFAVDVEHLGLFRGGDGNDVSLAFMAPDEVVEEG